MGMSSLVPLPSMPPWPVLPGSALSYHWPRTLVIPSFSPSSSAFIE